jgi:hypothetical protein
MTPRFYMVCKCENLGFSEVWELRCHALSSVSSEASFGSRTSRTWRTSMPRLRGGQSFGPWSSFKKSAGHSRLASAAHAAFEMGAVIAVSARPMEGVLRIDDWTATSRSISCNGHVAQQSASLNLPTIVPVAGTTLRVARSDTWCASTSCRTLRQCCHHKERDCARVLRVHHSARASKPDASNALPDVRLHDPDGYHEAQPFLLKPLRTAFAAKTASRASQANMHSMQSLPHAEAKRRRILLMEVPTSGISRAPRERSTGGQWLKMKMKCGSP